MRSLLKIIGTLLGLAVLGLGLLVGAAEYMNHRAARACQQFCGSLAAGLDASELRPRAEAAGARVREFSPDAHGQRMAAVFTGWIFNAQVCEVSFDRDGRLSHSRIVEEADP